MSELVRIVEEFARAVEAAELHNKQRGQGGQQVSFHGDFCNAPPSVMSRLNWWVREFRSAMCEMGIESPRPTSPEPDGGG